MDNNYMQPQQPGDFISSKIVKHVLIYIYKHICFYIVFALSKNSKHRVAGMAAYGGPTIVQGAVVQGTVIGAGRLKAFESKRFPTFSNFIFILTGPAPKS